MSWKEYDAEKPPHGVFLVAEPKGDTGWEVSPGRRSDSGKSVMWNGEPIPAGSMILSTEPPADRKAENMAGTQVFEDGEHKGELKQTDAGKRQAAEKDTGLEAPRVPAKGKTK